MTGFLDGATVVARFSSATHAMTEVYRLPSGHLVVAQLDAANRLKSHSEPASPADALATARRVLAGREDALTKDGFRAVAAALVALDAAQSETTVKGG